MEAGEVLLGLLLDALAEDDHPQHLVLGDFACVHRIHYLAAIEHDNTVLRCGAAYEFHL